MKQFCGSIAMLLVLCSSASAASIAGPYVFFGGVNGSVVSAPPNLNFSLNEDVYNASGGWGVSFSLLPNTPGMTYEVRKTVTNNTGTIWSEFGFGLDGSPLSVPPALVFLGTPSISGSGVGSASGSGNGNTEYGWTNLSIAPGETIVVSFLMQSCSSCPATAGSIAQFAGTAEAPEPASFVLLGSSLLGTALWHRQRRRGKR